MEMLVAREEMPHLVPGVLPEQQEPRLHLALYKDLLLVLPVDAEETVQQEALELLVVLPRSVLLGLVVPRVAEDTILALALLLQTVARQVLRQARYSTYLEMQSQHISCKTRYLLRIHCVHPLVLVEVEVEIGVEA